MTCDGVNKCTKAIGAECTDSKDCIVGSFCTSGDTKVCKTCDAGCRECTEQDTCTKCLPGYNEIIKGNCTPIENCPPGCATCKDAVPIDTETALKVCVTCAVGHTFDNGNTMIEGGKECVPCKAEGCDACTATATTCMQCGDDYNADGAGCVKKGLLDGAIVGIIIGAVAVAAIAGALVWYFILHRKGSTVSETEPEVPLQEAVKDENPQEIEVAVEIGDE